MLASRAEKNTLMSVQLAYAHVQSWQQTLVEGPVGYPGELCDEETPLKLKFVLELLDQFASTFTFSKRMKSLRGHQWRANALVSSVMQCQLLRDATTLKETISWAVKLALPPEFQTCVLEKT